MAKVQTRARVTVLVEIEVPDTWGEDCPMSQVHRQATESAYGMVDRLRRHPVEPSSYRIVGNPKVEMILVEVSK